MTISHEEEVRLLSMVDILEPLSQEELDELARRVPDTHLERGEDLYMPREHGEKLFLLKRGRVRVYEVTPEGRELTLSVVEDGNILGEMALTGQTLSGVYVRAIRPSIVCTLKRRDLERIILRTPEVGLRLVRVLSERLRVTETRLADLTHKDVLARLAGLISVLVESEGVVTGEGYKVPTHYTHQQLGSMIGSGRVSVTRALNKLQKAGAVELKSRYIHVTDLDALKHAAVAGTKNGASRATGK